MALSPTSSRGAPLNPPLSNLAVASDNDPGAIGAGKLWVRLIFDTAGDDGYACIFFRNSTNTGWNSLTPVTFQEQTGTFVASPDDTAELHLANGVATSALTAGGLLRLDGGSGVKVGELAVGFFGRTPVAKQTVAGAKLPSDVVLASLLTALVTMGLITDNST